MAGEAAAIADEAPGTLPTTRRAEHARRRRRRRRARSLATYVVLALAAVVVLFPIYVLIVDSLLAPSQLVSNPPKFVPSWPPEWSNYKTAFTTYDIGRYLLNSGIQTGIIVVAQLVTSVLAAYALACLRFPLRRTLFFVILGTVMIPFEVTASINLETVRSLGWEGSFLGLTAPFLATGFGIFLLRQAFLQIPPELREAAVLDGVGPMAFLWRVALPLARPVLAALAVFSFLAAWNQYLWPALLSANSQAPRTVQIGLASISNSADTAGIQLAGAVISLVPLVILLVFFRKNLIRSLTAGAVK